MDQLECKVVQQERKIEELNKRLEDLQKECEDLVKVMPGLVERTRQSAESSVRWVSVSSVRFITGHPLQSRV